MASALALPFTGLPGPWAALFWLAFLVICGMLTWTVALFLRARGWARREAADVKPQGDGEWDWVFLVPALNEAVTIADSVERLRTVEAASKLIVVIDDGSDDGTAEVLAGLADPNLVVLSRRPPSARQGKAAALNHAYGQLDRMIAARGMARERVIVCVVDADGRLDPRAPGRVAAHFGDERVGGVQLLVRIYNRGRFLAWMQDIEFAVYGYLYQAARSGWGTAGMGGNGQFNRLTALDDIADASGPWRDRLTEDQDLGLRLIGAGWQGRQELGAVVDQQGLSSLRRLYRQRTRWAQGNLQAIAHLPVAWRARLPFAARLDMVAYLLMPFWQTVVGVALVGAIYLSATGQAAFWGSGAWFQIVFFYLLGFGGVILGCIARGWGRAGLRGALVGCLLASLYAFYSWLLWPVLVRAAARELSHRRGWAKTQREAVA